MAKPVAEHPDYGCHHEYHAGGHVFHACDPFFMQPITVAELPDPPDPPTDLTSEIERRRRDLQNTAARKARQRNRRISGGAS
jgi:hypothetical protein